MARPRRRRPGLDPRPLLVALALARPAVAANCSPPTGQSTCLDADGLWLTPTPGPFLAIAAPEPMAPGEVSLGAATAYLSRPIVLRAPSPDPLGREVDVVESALTATAFGAYSPYRGLELAAAVPFVVDRTGTGIGGVTSQRAAPLEGPALRDPRLSASYAALQPGEGAGPRRSARLRMDLALPVGGAGSFAGDRSFVLSQVLSFGLRHEAFFAAAEVGARWRRSVELGGARFGSQLVSALGIGADFLGDQRLQVALETWILPVLVSQKRRLPNGTVTDGVLVPAEWMVSVQAAPLPNRATRVQLGAGGSLPLSSETRTTAEGGVAIERFAALTAPAHRIVLSLRHTFGAAPDAVH